MRPGCDEQNYYLIMPRALKYIRARGLNNNTLVLYYCIMELQNKNFWKPVYISERRLCYLAGIGHNTFIKCRAQLIQHHLVETLGDGVNAPRYEIRLAPQVELEDLPPVDRHANIYQLPWAHTRKLMNERQRQRLEKQRAEQERQAMQLERQLQSEREQQEENRQAQDGFKYDPDASAAENIQRLKNQTRTGA